MKEKNNKKQEPDFEIFAAMVAKLDEIKRREGKSSESYKSQHKSVVGVAEKLNQNNKGFASISGARSVNTAFDRSKGNRY